MNRLLWPLGILGTLLFLPWSSVSLTGDQRVYLSTAWEMWVNGSWLQPLLFGEPSYFKPPFHYWTILFSWRFWGVSLWAALLPSALAGIASARILSIFPGLPERESSALWFLSSLGVLTFSWVAQMEIWLVFFHLLAWWLVIRGGRGLYLSFLVAGLCALVKSPLYSVFFVVGVFGWMGWRRVKDWKIYAALFLGISIGSAWYLWIYAHDGERFLSQYWIQESVAKRGGNESHPWSIWISLLYWSVPATIPGIFGLIRIFKDEKYRELRNFLLAYSLPFALFFTLYPYRVNTYLFPLVPVLAIAAPLGWRESFTSRMLTGCLFLLFGAICLFLVSSIDGLPMAMGWVFFITGCAGLWAAFSAKPLRIFTVALAWGFFFRLAAVGLGEMDLSDLRSELVRHPEIKRLGWPDPGKNIWSDGTRISLALEKTPERISHPNQLATFLTPESALLLCEDLSEEEPFRMKLSTLKNSIDRIPWKRLQRRVRFPFREFFSGKTSMDRFQRNCEIIRMKGDSS